MDWVMLENRWMWVVCLVMGEDFNKRRGCGGFEGNGGWSVKGDCDGGKSKVLLGEDGGWYLSE